MYELDAGDQQNMMAAVDSRGEDIKKVVAAFVESKAGEIDAMIAKAKAM
jgi:hypothetical protein